MKRNFSPDYLTPPLTAEQERRFEHSPPRYSISFSASLGGAGYRRYSSSAKEEKPQYNRHRYRHVLVAFSPGGIIPLPFPIWLGFLDGLVVNCYHLGMVRYFLLESCRPDDKYLLSVRDDLERKLTEEGDFYVERVMLRYWVESLVRYVR